VLGNDTGDLPQRLSDGAAMALGVIAFVAQQYNGSGQFIGKGI